MDRKEFFNQLDMALGKIPYSDKKEILSDYEEHFNVGREKGKTEEQIIDALGDPKKIAKEYSADFYINQAAEEKSFSSIMRAVFAALGLGFANLIIVFPIWITVLAVLLALFVSSVAIALTGLTILILSPFISIIPVLGVGGILLGVGILCLGILMMVGFFFSIRGLFKATLSYLKGNIQIINGRRIEK